MSLVPVCNAVAVENVGAFENFDGGSRAIHRLLQTAPANGAGEVLTNTFDFCAIWRVNISTVSNDQSFAPNVLSVCGGSVCR